MMSRNELINKIKQNFDIRELVCPHCYKKFGEQSWQFLTTQLLSTLYVLRYVIFNKPITVNNWYKGGTLSQRGLRCNVCDIVKDKKDVYISAHILGNAIDFNVQGYTTEYVYEEIRNNIDKFEYPIRIESNSTTWAHCDCYQPINSNAVLIEFNG